MEQSRIEVIQEHISALSEAVDNQVHMTIDELDSVELSTQREAADFDDCMTNDIGVQCSATDKSSSSKPRSRNVEIRSTLAFICYNVSALTKEKMMQIMEWDADVYLLQEVRQTADEIRGANFNLAENGLKAIWGKPVPRTLLPRPKGIIQWKPAGGVAIAARTAIHLAEPKILTLLDSALRETGRVAYASTPFGRGHDVVHMFTYYGIRCADKRPIDKLNNEALERIATKVATLGGAPAIIALDGNQVPDNCTTRVNMLATGEWYDVAVEWHKKNGKPPLATFDTNARWEDFNVGSARTRIDWILANRSAMAALTHFQEMYHLTPTGSHVPLRA